MNHKELTNSIAAKLDMPKAEVEKLLGDTVSIFVEHLSAGTTIGLQGFGNMEVKKKEERISVHPATQVRTLVPPKLVVSFKQSNILKDKLKELPHE
ncbi:HU family DNA-binding protein [Paludibacter sp. 221]|uniref:HU family DNA-binding protein n=1 Tax=Paludibacter sp. 221 TaxID=2302939 RepID=UPI0013D53C0F|nr:HU family DNA-binding protein [Paludibacter sp. 221]NDV47666.1 HU family DNA-binding protein [Paludibacter sp. 221]